MKRILSYLFGYALLILPLVSAVAEADPPAICLIGDHEGIDQTDAQNAALLVARVYRSPIPFTKHPPQQISIALFFDE